MRVPLLLAVAGASVPVVCHAQWSSDPMVNTPVVERAGDQNEPKVRATADGGCYISWFDNSGGGYDVYMQRFDAQGVAQWATNGVLIRDRAVTSNQNYDLEVDGSGNAFIVFNDDVNANAPITAQLVSSAGVLLWGVGGVQASGTQAGGKSGPQAAVLSDGSLAVAWSNGSPNSVHVQKLDPSGAAIWPSPVLLSEAGRTMVACDIHAAEAGSMIVSWVRCGGTNCATSSKHLYAQKLSAAGAAMWDRNPGTPMEMEPVIVFDGTSLQTANFPTFVPDGAGGGVFTWYETGGNLDVSVQRVDAAGLEMFPHNGVPASIQASRFQSSPSVSFDAETGDAYVAWTESNIAQSQWGTYAQKISPDGLRAWGDNGVQLRPLGALQGSFVTAVARSGGGVNVFNFQSVGPVTGVVQGFALDGEGMPLWAGQPVSVCSVSSSKARLSAARATDGATLVAWGDGRADTNNIYAQRVNTDGSLGESPPAECLADFDENGIREVRDIFVYLAAWFAMDASADIDSVPGIGVPDIFAFLSLWFAGCP